jgi:hypothetical protein
MKWSEEVALKWSVVLRSLAHIAEGSAVADATQTKPRLAPIFPLWLTLLNASLPVQQNRVGNCDAAKATQLRG